MSEKKNIYGLSKSRTEFVMGRIAKPLVLMDVPR